MRGNPLLRFIARTVGFLRYFPDSNIDKWEGAGEKERDNIHLIKNDTIRNVQ